MLKLSFAYFFLSHYSAVDFLKLIITINFSNAYLELKLGLSDTAPQKRPLLYIKYDSLSPIIDLNFKPISASITTTLYPNRAIDIPILAVAVVFPTPYQKSQQ
jgi:hypothetical protein